MMKKLLIPFLGGMLAAMASVADGQTVAPNWPRLCDAYKTFRANPDSRNASAVTGLLPKRLNLPLPKTRDEQRCWYYIADHLEVLSKKVQAGDVEAVRLAFRLMAISDGHMSEELDIMLGKLAIPHPRLFLKLLAENRELVVRLDALLGNLGEEYVDRFEAQCLALRRRVRALQTVTDTSLAHVRDEAIAALKDQISDYCRR